MSMARRPSPFGELLSLRQAMDRLFEDSFVRPRTWPTAEAHGLPVDVTNAADALIVEAALPGIRPDGYRRDRNMDQGPHRPIR